MKIKHYLILIIVLFILQLYASGQNPIIQSIVNQVSGDSIFKHIDVLQKFDRQTLKNHRECTDYIYKYLKQSDFDTIYYQEMEFEWTISGKDSLYTSLPNIIAIKYGKNIPDSIYIIGAHYDAPWVLDIISGEYTLEEIPTSPAADDNASGTSAVIEISRVLTGYHPERTIMFILFAAEEIGVAGSEYFIDNFNEKNKILGMINLDMIAYSENKNNPLAVIQTNSISKNIFDCCTTSISQYVSDLPYEKSSTDAGDHISFWEYNIPAISFIDGHIGGDSFNPYIHTMADTIGCSANDTILAELITKAVLATIMELDSKGTPAQNEVVAMKKPGFKLYPNPSKNYVNIEIEDLHFGISRIEILNLQGQVIQSIISNSKKNIIDISKYAKGVYFFRVNNTVNKFIKM